MAFTMPALSFVAPSGTVDSDDGYSLVPNATDTLRVSWTATGLVTFTGHFRNKSTNALIGAQTFTNNSSGNWLWANDPSYDGVTRFGFEMDTITSNGKTITLTFSVDNGINWSGKWVRRSGVWVWAPVYVRRSSAWVFAPYYVRRSGVWVLSHH